MDSSPPPISPAPSPPPVGAVNSGQQIPQQSIWSLVLGILSFCLWILGSIPAIILGIIGIKKANADPENIGGRGLAIAGIITGSLGIFVGLFTIIIPITLPAYNQVQKRAELAKEINSLRMLSLACRAYAADHEGEFPPSLQDLYPDYVDNESLLSSSTKGSPSSLPYSYRTGFTDSSPANEPFIMAPAYLNGRIAVAFVGGHVREIRPPETELIESKFN